MRVAQDIIEDSQRLIPRDTGAMASSDYIEDNGSHITFGYNGEGIQNPKTGQSVSEYIIQQHEDTSLNHPNGGEAKFLEKAIDYQIQAEAQETVADELLNVLTQWTPSWRGRGKRRGRGAK